MKKIRLFKISDNDIRTIVEVLQHTNGIFKYENGICKVLKNGLFEQYQVELLNHDDSTLSQDIKNIILNSHSQVKDWKLEDSADQEQFGFINGFNETILEKDINLWLYWLFQNKKLDVINICCYISFKLLTTKHYWENGNKRTSITTLMNLLDSSHYFLSFTGLQPEQIKMRWYEIFLKYLERSRRNDDGTKEDPESIYQDFYNEIFKSIYLNAKYIL